MRKLLSTTVFGLIAGLLLSPAASGQVSLTSSLGFGNQVLNVTSSPRSAILKNTQSVPLTISQISISGGNAAADFAWGGNCPITPNTLGAGKNCSIAVTLTPSALGSRSATLTVTDDASTSPQNTNLSGSGVEPVVLSASSFVFGAVAVGNTSTAKSVTLTNYQKVALAFSSIATSGEFTIASNTCGSNIAAGANCKIGVTFSPQELGSHSGILTFSDNAATSPQTVNLSGSGSSPLTFSSPSLKFGSVSLGLSSSAQTLTLTNHLTTAVFFSTPTASGDFAVAGDNCGSSIGAGLQCTVQVTFTPSQAGTRTGSLAISYGAFGSPSTIGLSGSGSTALNGTFFNETMMWDGITRYYLVYVPQGLPPNPAMVMMLHGTSTSTTPPTSKEFGWRLLADIHHFIEVQPAATLNTASGAWNWNAYFLDDAFQTSPGPDDSGFLRQLITNLTVQYTLDPKQIFVAGFSSGAEMAQRVGVDISDLVAAIIPASGQISAVHTLPIILPNPPVAPVSVQELHGTQDTLLPPCNHGTTQYSGVRFNLATVDETFNYWTQQNACTQLQTTQPLCMNGAANPAVTGNDATTCTNNVEVQFIWEQNVEHQWLMNNIGERWNFFANHPKQ